ncbi:pilus assembly FimT family protein [Xanthomonas graminis]|jgi:type IV fimbrial biogenesis protein FimT|uniref:Fimbrial biogenesis protein n=1 Tax=Xanthomonas graminis pv. graminis TaxID=134874 RepID=A0A1M4IIX6_9XANT|nr:prepilin-type N-terminal cleavage/methylation domain-containing protein [Xanthomonas translucens]EKU25030.1 hypothetical protein XTG29_02039 [Xanthomonas translucens pv. graminis ART-Xtg29]UKE52961.1 prepilin-type N-terminal cleavage/methylation domain-containing protein [Xanthomonas translucens pv. graminis]WIH10151.1 prepilin-type N-terminal cleavage/methylation domain-containing protein [Xanthomonas translucens pv. graminis]WIH13551.1 prepilin-type N-terminal cleavage/methylation domain-c
MSQRIRGFTLMEALAAMAVILITLCIGLPNFGRLLDRHRQLAATNELLAQLALARS